MKIRVFDQSLKSLRSLFKLSCEVIELQKLPLKLVPDLVVLLPVQEAVMVSLAIGGHWARNVPPQPPNVDLRPSLLRRDILIILAGHSHP